MVIFVTAILTCVGVVLIVRGAPMPGWQLLGFSLLVLLGTLFERWRYRRVSEGTNDQWQRTSERFLDPETGQPVEVLFDPRTGERRYVTANPADDHRPSP